MAVINTEKDQPKKSLLKPVLIGGAVVTTLIIISNVVKVIQTASQTDVVTETPIQVLEVPSPSPMIGQSPRNKDIELADQKLVVAGQYLDDVSDKWINDLVVARAKKWLVNSTAEAPKQNKSEAEYLSDKLLYYHEDLTKISNNGALEATPNKMDNAVMTMIEIRAIKTAMTETKLGGAIGKVNTVNLLEATGQLYRQAMELNHVQRFGASEVLNRPVENRQEVIPVEDPATGKAFDETEEVKTNEGN